MVFLYFLTLLALTVAAETPLMALMSKDKHACYALFLCNLLTNPFLNLVLALLACYAPAAWFSPAVAGLEVAVVAAEGVLLKKMCRFSSKKAMLFSLAVNGASYLLGVLMQPVLCAWFL